jgi:hypothetical protein
VSAPPSPTLWVLDPGLFFEGGHHASFARTISAETASRGMGCEIVGLGRIDHPPGGIEIVRHFSHSAYAVLEPGDPIGSLRALNDAFEEDLSSLRLDRDAGDALVLFPTITSRIVLGAARWAAERAANGRAGIAMLLMFPPGFAGDDELRRAERKLYREAMSILRGVPRGGVRLFAETTRIASVFEELGAPPIDPLPWPLTVSRTDGERSERGPQARVVHLGYSKVERGFALLPGCVERVTAGAPGTRFRVQSNYWDPTGLAEADEALGRLPSVEVLRGPLVPSAYANELASADIVVLPYRADAYRYRGSGVFVEAAALGRVLIIPAETWMAEHAREHGLAAVEFASFDESSVASALLHAIEHREAMLGKAADAAPAWADARSPTRFLDAVLAGRRTATIDRRGENAA